MTAFSDSEHLWPVAANYAYRLQAVEWCMLYWMQGNQSGISESSQGLGSIAIRRDKPANAVENVASQKVIEKLGCTRTGENLCGFTKNSLPLAEYEYAIDFHAH